MNHEVRVEVYDQIVEITIDRPPANAINPGVSDAIYEALSRLQEDENLRVGIITGGGHSRLTCLDFGQREYREPWQQPISD